jgi:hypothetical protein
MKTFAKLIGIWLLAVVVLNIINPLLKPAQDEHMRQVQLRDWEREAVNARAAALATKAGALRR